MPKPNMHFTRIKYACRTGTELLNNKSVLPRSRAVPARYANDVCEKKPPELEADVL